MLAFQGRAVLTAIPVDPSVENAISKSKACEVMKKFIHLSLAVLLAPAAMGAVIFDDGWADGDRTKTGALDADWWSSSSTGGNSVEVSAGAFGLVTGTSGRGAHGTFAPQTLGIGESLVTTYAFTTPATVGINKGGAFKVAVMEFNNAGLAADLSSSSSSVNPLYTNLPGYMTDFDIDTGSEDISIRKHEAPNASGRFLGTTGEWDSLGSSADVGYKIVGGTGYVGVISLTRTGADSMDIFGSLSQGGVLLDSYTKTDDSNIANNFGMIGFWANSNTFGSTNGDDPDNGITFTNVKVELETQPVPEPSSAFLLLLGGLLALGRRSRRV